jgi:hypothetical protein
MSFAKRLIELHQEQWITAEEIAVKAGHSRIANSTKRCMTRWEAIWNLPIGSETTDSHWGSCPCSVTAAK